jgi:structural maintenance of chromosome 2
VLDNLTLSLLVGCAALQAKKSKLAGLKARLKECDSEIDALEKAKTKAEKKITDIGNEKKKLEKEARNIEAESVDADKLVRSLFDNTYYICTVASM